MKARDILCQHCHRSIEWGARDGWQHRWSLSAMCNLGRSTWAEPETPEQRRAREAGARAH